MIIRSILSVYRGRVQQNCVRKMSTRLFEDKDHASLYAKYRPSYPEKVYEHIAKFCSSGEGTETYNFDLAVDVACGSGQSTMPLCKLYKDVIGYDISEQQIASAPNEIDNLFFKVGPGKNLSFLKDNSVDLVTIAQALHWLDVERFYSEVRRVVKPGGVFAAYGYGTCYFDNEYAQTTFMEFYKGIIGPYWDKQRKHVEEEYRGLGFPFNNSKRIDGDDITIHRSMPVDAFIGYVSSMSSWRTLIKQNPDSDGLDQLRKRLEDIYGSRNVDVYWTVSIVIGKKD